MLLKPIYHLTNEVHSVANVEKTKYNMLPNGKIIGPMDIQYKLIYINEI